MRPKINNLCNIAIQYTKRYVKNTYQKAIYLKKIGNLNNHINIT